MKKCDKCQLEYSEASGFCPACEDPLIEAAGPLEAVAPLEATTPLEAAAPLEMTAPQDAAAPPETAPPPIEGAVSPDETCPACQAEIQPNWKFCKFCGHRLDETTVIRSRESAILAEPVPELGAGSVPPSALSEAAPAVPAAAKTPSAAAPTVFPGLAPPLPATAPDRPLKDLSTAIAPPFRPFNCSNCGHENYAGRKTCESCGMSFVPVKERGGRKKAAIVAAVVLGLFLVLAVLGVGGRYLLGSTVTVQTNPGEVTVLVDGREVGRTDGAGSLSVKRIRPGDHTLVVRKEGFADWTQTFNVSFAEFQKGLNVKLEPVLWKLTLVTTPPGSSIYVDENPVGTTDFTSGSLEIPNLAPGNHVVTARLPGYLEWKQTVTLSGNQALTATLVPETPVTTGTPEEKIKTVLDGWAAAMRARSLDQVMGFYGEVLSSYNEKSAVPKANVRDEYAKTLGIFKQVEVQLTNVKVVVDAAGASATVTFDDAFSYQADGNMNSTGSVQMQLTMTKTGDAWLITGEKKLKTY